MKGLSKKELEVVSFLEMNEKSFFAKEDVEQFFESKTSMNFTFHKLMEKKRVEKMNRNKYYLIPVRAFNNNWSEHPFIIADEIFNGKNYCIAGVAAAHYWGLIEQIPTKVEIWCTKKQGYKKVLGIEFIFKRRRKIKGFVERSIKEHSFKILDKDKVREWLKSR